MALGRQDDELANVIEDSLTRHNFYREKHGVPALRISSKLNGISQEWADNLVNKDRASHRPNNAFGENIFVIMSSTKVTDLGVKAVDSWYSEIKFFDFQATEKEMDATTKAFHFTQVVWRKSQELGVGASKNAKSGTIYVVCNYDPPGNFLTQFKENVSPPVADAL